MLMVDKYTVENERIVPGQDFTLTLTLKNYSNTNTATNIMLNVENPEGVAPVHGTTSQVFVGRHLDQRRQRKFLLSTDPSGQHSG